MFNLHFVSCKCNKTLFVTFMADLELADGRERFRLSKKELASLKGSSTIEHFAKALWGKVKGESVKVRPV